MPTAPRPRRPFAVLLTLALTIGVTSAGVAVARQQDPPVVRQAPVGTGAVAATRATPVRSSVPMPDLASAASLRREHRMVIVPAAVARKTSWTSSSARPGSSMRRR